MFEQIKQNVKLINVTTETWLKLKHNKVWLMIAKIWVLPQTAPLVEGELSPSSSYELYPVWLGFLSSFSASVPISLTPLSVHSLHLFPLIFPSHHLPPLHPYSFILIIFFFNSFQKRLCLSSYLSVSSRVLPCVCPPACCGRLCTQRLVCSASPSAQQPPLLFNVTGPLLLPLSTVGGFSSVWRFPSCRRCLLWKKNNRKPEETTGHYILTVLPFSPLFKFNLKKSHSWRLHFFCMASRVGAKSAGLQGIKFLVSALSQGARIVARPED